MNKKKRIIIWVVVILSIIGSIVYVFSYRNIEKVLGVDYSKVDKILTSSGNSSKIIEITDKDEIMEYVKIFHGINVRRDVNQLKTAGFCLEVRFFNGEDEVGYMVYGYNKMTINDTKYISDKNIDKNQIEDIRTKYNMENQN